MKEKECQLSGQIKGLGYSLVEFTETVQKKSVQVRAVICNGAAGSESIGTEDCSKVHRVLLPRLELAHPGKDIYLEVSSPGIDRLIKDNREFAVFTGKKVRCYRTDISDWTAGVLESADEEGIKLKTEDGIITLRYEVIAKARLNNS